MCTRILSQKSSICNIPLNGLIVNDEEKPALRMNIGSSSLGTLDVSIDSLFEYVSMSRDTWNFGVCCIKMIRRFFSVAIKGFRPQENVHCTHVLKECFERNINPTNNLFGCDCVVRPDFN